MTQAHESPRALLVTVDHGGADATLELVKSLRQLRHFHKIIVVIVSNTPHADSSLAIRSRLEPSFNIQLIESTSNRGYFGNAEWGIQRYQHLRGPLPDWVIVCNNDTKIKQEDFLERLFRLDPGKVGAIGPRIISCLTQLDQNPFMDRRPGRWRVAELRFWLANYHLACLHERLSSLKKAIRRHGRRVRPGGGPGNDRHSTPIYAPHGSFIIFTAEFFRRGGYIDDGPFLYYEEISVAEICRRIRLPVVYEPELLVFHDEHRSTGQRFNRATYRHQKEAMEHLTMHYLVDVA